MRSKFSLNIIGPITCFFLLLFAMIFCAFAFFMAGISTRLICFVDMPIFLIMAWIFYGEFRTKMIVVVFGYDYIITVSYGGAGHPKKILYSELDGYATSSLWTLTKTFEYLYFVKDGKKVAKISEFYHSNYEEMKKEIEGKLKNLGHVEFNYWTEIKESFT